MFKTKINFKAHKKENRNSQRIRMKNSLIKYFLALQDLFNHNVKVEIRITQYKINNPYDFR